MGSSIGSSGSGESGSSIVTGTPHAQSSSRRLEATRPSRFVARALAFGDDALWSEIMKRPRATNLLLAALTVLVTVAVYSPVLENGFVNWDDDKNFIENPNYRGL